MFGSECEYAWRIKEEGSDRRDSDVPVKEKRKKDIVWLCGRARWMECVDPLDQGACVVVQSESVTCLLGSCSEIANGARVSAMWRPTQISSASYLIHPFTFDLSCNFYSRSVESLTSVKCAADAIDFARNLTLPCAVVSVLDYKNNELSLTQTEFQAVCDRSQRHEAAVSGCTRPYHNQHA